jgi:hypothetical protein
MRYRLVEPLHHLHNTWSAPFFFEDSHHVFYVSTAERVVRVRGWHRYGIAAAPGYQIRQMPSQEKFTNEQLYLWMQGEIVRLYYEYYRFAFAAERKAEYAQNGAHVAQRPVPVQ